MKPRDAHLKCVLRGGKLIIEIGVETLAFAALRAPWTVVDGLDGSDRGGRVTDADAFSAEVANALTDEAEDGSSMITKLFDDASMKAWENGADGVDVDLRPKKGRRR